MSSITADRDALLLKTPYHPALVAALKAQIPASGRAWVGSEKAWRLASSYGPTVVCLVQQFLGENLALPPVSAPPQPETRLLDLRYLGACKARGAGESTAYGWVDGGWHALFPESVLRSWFCAPSRPDEQPTLYQVLGLNAGTGPDDIKKAYRRLARQWHPDTAKHEPDAAQVFIAIQRAYETLSDSAKRARYDTGLAFAATLDIAHITCSQPAVGYRSPLRCGYVLAEGLATLSRFAISKILAWEDIVDAYGRTLVVTWPMGADIFQETWQ